MITRELFDKITKEYGSVASWAIWDDEGKTPKSNMSNMDVLNPDKNINLLNIIKTNIIIVGLSVSRDVHFTQPYMNFHVAYPYANDFKIRYAFRDTPYYGAYMTDIVKNSKIFDSKEVEKYLKKNPDVLAEHIESFRKELAYIEADKPIIIAFGAKAYNILSQNLRTDEYRELIKILCYSHQISKENYKKDVLEKVFKSKV